MIETPPQIKNMERQEKERVWEEISRNVENMGDKKGLGVDEKITLAVIALKANKFGTTQSCEGHLDWGNPWPWVQVESPLAEQLLTDTHYKDLTVKAREKQLSEKEAEEYHEKIQAQINANQKEYQRLQKLLKEFYESVPQENKDGITLDIKRGPWNQSRLQPAHMPKGMPDEVRMLWTPEERTKNLDSYRQEMDRFVSFLKTIYFETNK